MNGPLHGVKVLEIAQVHAVPAAGTLLSDMGAEVTKIEPPWGDSTRYGRPLLPGEGRNFIGLNHGKRSICLDLGHDGASEVLRPLLERSDVVLVNLRSDQVRRYALSYESCRAINETIIYVGHTAAGPEGPLAGLGGYDMTIAALAGIGSKQAFIRGDQLVNATGVALTDAATGFVTVAAVSAALYHRALSGAGQKIETSNLASALNCQMQTLISFDVDRDIEEEIRQELGRLRAAGADFAAMQHARTTIGGRDGTAGAVYYRFYRTRDSYIAIGALSPALAARTRAAVGIEDPRQQPGFDIENDAGRAVLDRFAAEVEERLRSRTTDDWVEVFTAQGVPHARLNFPEEVLLDPQVTANGYAVELEHELFGRYVTPAPPMRMSATPVAIRASAPTLDQHTDHVLREAGFDDIAIQRLRVERIVGRSVELPEDYH